jgi:hypothetical protein
MIKYSFEKFKKNIIIINFYQNNKVICKKILKIPFNLDNDIYTEYNNNNFIINTKFNNYIEEIEKIIIFENLFLSDDLTIKLKLNNLDKDINIDKNIDINKDINIDKSIDINKDINIDINKDINIDKTENNKEYTNIYSIKINLKYLLLNNYIDLTLFNNAFNIKYNIYFDHCNINIDKIGFIIYDYNPAKIDLFGYFNYNHDIDVKINIIRKCFVKLTEMQNEIDFIHGDFKLNNILVSNNDNDITFIDLEFTEFIKNNKYINKNNFKLINLYLLLNNQYNINGYFLKLFDVYLFALSFIMKHNNDFNELFIYKISVILNDCLDETNFYLFYTIYILLYEYSKINNVKFYKINNDEYLDYCLYKTIKKILYKKNIIYIKDKKIINNIYVIKSLYLINNMYENIYCHNLF